MHQKISVEVLQEYAVELWEVFVEEDTGLASSTCSCCKKKRELRDKVLAASMEHRAIHFRE